MKPAHSPVMTTAARRFLLLVAIAAAASAYAAPSVFADAPAPGWHLFGDTYPTNLPPGGAGDVDLTVQNDGGTPSAPGATLTVRLPEGLTAVSEAAESGLTPGCTIVEPRLVTCVVRGTTPAAFGEETGYVAIIPVSVGATASGEKLVQATISGGGAPAAGSSTTPVRYDSTAAGLGVANSEAWASNADGTLDTQAGSHPYLFTLEFALNAGGTPLELFPAGGEAQSINAKLPPGLVGDPTAVPYCPRAVFDSGPESGEFCPRASQIGWDNVTFVVNGLDRVLIPLYNLVPPAGVAAQFGFGVNGEDGFLDAQVRSGGDYGITIHAGDIPQIDVLENTAVIWGVPGEHGTGAPPVPFLSLPTACGVPELFTTEVAGTWQNPSLRTHRDFEDKAGLTGCERLVQFQPMISLVPDTSFADTPAGLTADLHVPQGVNPEGLATSSLKDTTVTLPAGLVINPGQATGLVACQASQENIGGEEAEDESEDGPPSCPAASKVGTDEISTPLLPDRLLGNVYILQSNPPELKLLVVASGDGVSLKLVGTVHLNETTGQLTTVFENTPDAPFSEFKLSFSGGAQAALATPAQCGTYGSATEFTPWSSPFVEDALATSSFQITGGTGGGPCASPLPFSPVMSAGATTDQAGGFTDFSLLLQRGDDQQRVSSLQFKTPEGLLGMISKVPLCRAAEAASGTCPAASQIGHTIVGAGPGPYPLFIPEAGQPPAPIYLTEGYRGAPYGLSIVVPIHAGPFTLQTQVVRASIAVDPHTSQLTITTDPLPTIIDGIPADLRSIDAVIDRPGFMFNPTDCNPASFTGTATSTEGATAPISTPFQVGSCRALTFKPDFKVSTSGKTSKKYGASLDAKIVYPATPLGANQASSQANIASVKVDLPKQLPSRLTTLQKACTAAVFEANPANCPAASVVGRATAVTPVLPVALTGPAYFVSHGGEAFPSLIVVLQGDGVTVDLVGTTFISKAGITSSTFKQVPDVPISSFDLSLPEGPYSALGTNLPAKDKYSFCGQKLVMPTAFTAQNGAVINQSTPVSVTGCPKGKKASKKTKKKAHKSSRSNGNGRKQ